MHATVAKHYFFGGSFPIGGSSQVVGTIDPVIKSAGGTILINAEVEEIIIKDNKAKGVKMKDGKTFFADLIVSGTGVKNTFGKLVPESVSVKHNFKDQLKNVAPSAAHVCLYLGLNASPEELQLTRTNLWIYPEKGDHDTCVANYLNDINEDFPVVYISFPSAKDPDWSNRYPNKSTIDIITLVPFEIFAPWEGTRWMKRGDEYLKEKEKITTRLLEKLYKQLPHLEGRIDHQELSTPLTTQHFINYEKGEIYGLEHTPDRFNQKFLKPKTPIKNLYLTGQDIVSAGVGAALFSGLLTASTICKKNFMSKIYE